jgi:diguanylate cyclase (GGDEF)-like protein
MDLAKRANHDLLTGVYSRHFIIESINLELSRFNRHGNHFSVLFIDFDDFKPINDMYGHKIGDDALVAMAKTINSCLRDIDVLGRYGGDEFLVCLPETTAQEAKVIAQRIQHSLKTSLQNISDHEINITASIGIYSPEDAAIDTQFIIEHADKAVYLAKMKGKNRIEIV